MKEICCPTCKTKIEVKDLYEKILDVLAMAFICVCIGVFVWWVTSKEAMTVEDHINALTPPLEVTAISTEGDVLLTDATGKMFTVPGEYAIARTIATTFKPGHVLLKN